MDDQNERNTRRWFGKRQSMWRETAEGLQQIEQSERAPREVVLRTARAYPEIARDLAIARRTAPTGRLTRQLERIYAHLHRALHLLPNDTGQALRDTFEHDVPRVVAALESHILATVGLFLASLLAGWWIVATYPELIALFASEEMVEHVQRGELWVDDLLNVLPSSVLAVGIFTNNIVVALMTVCAGVVYGLGTIYMIALNGLMLGGVFAFTAQHDLAQRLFSFVTAHGFVELSAICIAGAVGISLGEAVARPGNSTRAAGFQVAVRDGSKVMIVCIAFLIGAGIIEGYVSPDPRFPLAARLAIGLGYLFLFVRVLTRGISIGRDQIRR